MGKRLLNRLTEVERYFYDYFQKVISILKIKKSHRNTNEWLVYNPDNFALHTHCRSRRVALVIRNNVLKQRLPKSTDPYLIESHARLTGNRQYKKLLEERINEIKKQKTQMRPQLENGGHYLCEKP